MCLGESIFIIEGNTFHPPACLVPPICSPKDSTDEFNLSKVDLNVFLLPHTVCGRQHGLQEPEERGP